jgi:iron complex transport system permease protein
MAAIVGGFVMVAASILSKILVPGSVVPIGIVTAIIGVPFMMSLILRRHRGL